MMGFGTSTSEKFRKPQKTRNTKLDACHLTSIF